MGHSPGNWLAAYRADLTLGKTAICIFVAKFYELELGNCSISAIDESYNCNQNFYSVKK